MADQQKQKPAIMFQGTGSDVGKSLLVTGLARALTRRGFKVRPFKPQNMSNNAAVTDDGGEIGRAQALQARACYVKPSTDMNPVLLKPQTDYGSQVIVQGRIWGNTDSGVYWKTRQNLMPKILESFYRLSREADIVLVEGAGSPAEANLRKGDIANMGFAEAADIPVVLIGDIDRGGVIASLIGTKSLLSESENKRICGYLINKFRGEASLFDSGLEIINRRTGFFPMGVVPFFARARQLPDEDAVSVQEGRGGKQCNGPGYVKIVVPLLSRISNFDDFDPLILEERVDFSYVHPGEVIPPDADIIILPGSKATIADLTFFRAQGWDIDLAAHVRRGGFVMGICGGYQMMGRSIEDPMGVEGKPCKVEGLGLLPLRTVMTNDKSLVEKSGHESLSRAAFHGYEMHIGRTELSGDDPKKVNGETGALLTFENGEQEGFYRENGRISGCYMHGIFASDAYRQAFLRRILQDDVIVSNYDGTVESALDALGDHLEKHCNLDAMIKATGLKVSSKR